MLKIVMENTSIQKMRQDLREGRITEFNDEMKPLNGEKLEFIRKGVVGDYMNHFN